MKIKKYEATTEQQAMEKIKEELGSDAIILSIKKTQPRGIFAFFRKPLVEVTAAYDERFHEKYAVVTSQAASATVGADTNLMNAASGSAHRPSIDLVVGDAQVEDGSQEDKLSTEIFNKNKKIFELEEVIRGLERKRKADEELLLKMEEQLGHVEHEQRQYKNSIVQIIYNTLIEQGVLPEVAARVLKDADAITQEEAGDIELVTKIVYNAIIQALGDPLPLEASPEQEGPGTAFFLGPTGVGKTTTIAKLSSSFILHNDYKVGLITADTYRIAAVEQLKTYGEILGIDVNVVYKSEDLRRSLEKLRRKADMILIDTAGRSHRNSQNLAELKDILDAVPNSRKYLVLSAATRYEDIMNIIDIYSSVAEFGLIFTKLDETSYFGCILNVCCLTDKRISYVTYGQNVPDDIEIVQPDKLAKALLGFGGDLF